MSAAPVQLPIESVLPALRAALASHANVVLQAPPGAGKSTGVPLALLGERWLGKRKIVMLEPRRLAARTVATRMASVLGESVGRTIGYRTRLDTKVSTATRVEVVTEGILTRALQRDPALEDAGLVIFDEFHERSLNADLGLALCLDAQSTLRDDLRLLVMSATLAERSVARLLGDAPIIASEGRTFPVDTQYRERLPGRSTRATSFNPDEDVARVCAGTIAKALEQERGDLLVFLPGQGEIRRVERLLQEAAPPREVRVLPLFGDLPVEQQDAAILPSPAGQRKVVLATNIAETSLTIEGVRIVIDSGLERRSRFDPSTGMSRLETTRISRASADQRRGRAGRIEPGVCYRLWSEGEHALLAAHAAPEILEADLAPLALELANWGVSDPQSLRWLDAPPAATFAQAGDLLRTLEALDAHGRINDHGRALARLGTHPRLAHMIVKAQDLGAVQLALRIAGVLSERDFLRTQVARRDVDLRLRLEALGNEADVGSGVSIDAGARQRVLRSIDVLRRQFGVQNVSGGREADLGRLLAFAYPDRIAQSRGSDGRYLLRNGRGAQLPGAQSIAQREYLVVADLDAGERESVIRLAAPTTLDDIERDFAMQIESRERIEWSSREQAVIARRERWLGALLLEERRIDDPDGSRLIEAMVRGIEELGLAALPWSKESRSTQQRISFARTYDTRPAQPWPDVSDDALKSSIGEWLAPWLEGMTRRDHLARLDLQEILRSQLSWEQQQRLERIAPTHLTVPSGSRIPIDYSGESPAVAVRLQEVFGLRQTPAVAEGNVPLTLQLLSPAHRPVQVTKDLTSFWARGYIDVKKELKGRYPKHYWPDDPLTAEPTSRAKRRSER